VYSWHRDHRPRLASPIFLPFGHETAFTKSDMRRLMSIDFGDWGQLGFLASPSKASLRRMNIRLPFILISAVSRFYLHGNKPIRMARVIVGRLHNILLTRKAWLRQPVPCFEMTVRIRPEIQRGPRVRPPPGIEALGGASIFQLRRARALLLRSVHIWWPDQPGHQAFSAARAGGSLASSRLCRGLLRSKKKISPAIFLTSTGAYSGSTCQPADSLSVLPAPLVASAQAATLNQQEGRASHWARFRTVHEGRRCAFDIRSTKGAEPAATFSTGSEAGFNPAAQIVQPLPLTSRITVNRFFVQQGARICRSGGDNGAARGADNPSRENSGIVGMAGVARGIDSILSGVPRCDRGHEPEIIE